MYHYGKYHLVCLTGAGGPQIAKLVSERERAADVDIDVSPSGGSDVDDEYFSMDDDDSEGSESEGDETTRELERQRVFEAAGLIVATNPPIETANSPLQKQKRRTPPAAPDRVPTSFASSSKELPPVPTLNLANTELDSSSSHLEDAFDRYETFKKTNGIINNRMSVSSLDTSLASPSSPPRSPAVSLTPSLNHRDGESRTSQFLSFLGRHTTRSTTPEPDRRSFIISGPIPAAGGESGPNRVDTPSFGTVRVHFIARIHIQVNG